MHTKISHILWWDRTKSVIKACAELPLSRRQSEAESNFVVQAVKGCFQPGTSPAKSFSYHKQPGTIFEPVIKFGNIPLYHVYGFTPS